MIALDPRDKAILDAILAQHPYHYYVYGSRVKGTHGPYSDLDICILEDIERVALGDLREACEQSNLSIKIDFKRWADMDDAFRGLIQDHWVQWER